MRNIIVLLLLILWPTIGQSQRCFSHIRENTSLETHLEYAKEKRQIEAFTQTWINKYQQRVKAKTTYQIPVVVHVVWYELNENISEEQVISQIEVLNQDFQALNTDLALVPENFRSLIADTEISFCLANSDPQGNPSNGITRTQTSYANVGTAQDGSGRFRIYYTESGGQDVWDSEKYLNIWVAQRGYGSGLASFPGTSPPEEDGLVIDFRYFGTKGTAVENAPYHLGRTVTHELGHYFNLIHLWGRSINPNCENDDDVEDTPRQSTTYLSECPKGQPASCGTADLFFNFMNYTDDACMAMFTLGQKMRMLAALEGPRSGLIENGNLCNSVNSSTDNISHPPFNVWNDSQNGVVWIEPNNIAIQINIQLFNLLGQRLWQEKQRINSRKVLSLPKLNPGIYLLHLQWQNNSYSSKIIIH